jgi:hypothetical protein
LAYRHMVYLQQCIDNFLGMGMQFPILAYRHMVYLQQCIDNFLGMGILKISVQKRLTLIHSKVFFSRASRRKLLKSYILEKKNPAIFPE